MQFFKVTAKYKEMLLLEFIQKNISISQPDIAKYIGSSTSMVNTYIDDLEKKEFLFRNYKSLKMVEYNITSLGIKRKNFLQITYMKELMKLYLEGRNKVLHFLESIIVRGYKDVIFYGAGEVAEIMLDIIKKSDFKIKVMCIVDDDIEKQNKELYGVKICSLDEICNLEHDGLIITSYTFEDQIIDKLSNINYSKDKIIRYFEI